MAGIPTFSVITGVLVSGCERTRWVPLRNDLKWVSVGSFGSGLEAELVVQKLEAEGIVAISRGNDVVGIFGPGFQGRTSRGVDVLVPSDAVRAARAVLDGTLDDEGDYFDEEES